MLYIGRVGSWCTYHAVDLQEHTRRGVLHHGYRRFTCPACLAVEAAWPQNTQTEANLYMNDTPRQGAASLLSQAQYSTGETLNTHAPRCAQLGSCKPVTLVHSNAGLSSVVVFISMPLAIECPRWQLRAAPRKLKGAVRRGTSMPAPRASGQAESWISSHTTLPTGPDSTVRQAEAAITGAFRNGMLRQLVEIPLPLTGATELDDW